jgi:hypothetical protein
LNTLAEVFPSREIVPIYSGDLIWGFGALHCMTQQQPLISKNKNGEREAERASTTKDTKYHEGL